ncbi:hypothetical protein ABEW05_001171 [Botrytis cinerea]
MDAENIHTILVTSHKRFIVEPSRLHATESFLGRVIFNTDGLSWKQAHLATKPIFARAQISNLDVLKELMDVLLAIIPHDGTTVDLLPLLKRLFLDTSMALIFGNLINSLEPEEGQFDTGKFLAAFDIALQGIGLRAIERAEKLSSSTNSPSPNRRLVLLDELLKTAQSLRSQLLNIFLPARDQTAIAVGNIFFHLERHPESWNRLRNEIFKYDGPLAYESLKQMKRLRILVPSGRSIKSCGEDCILPTGGGSDGKDPGSVARETEVNYMFKSMHLDKDI